jgi:hypothetical protein
MSANKDHSRKPIKSFSNKKKAYALQPCPVALQTNEVLRSSQETALAMSELRRTFMECEHCPAFGDCELREEFNKQVDMAIAELLEEWGW